MAHQDADLGQPAGHQLEAGTAPPLFAQPGPKVATDGKLGRPPDRRTRVSGRLHVDSIVVYAKGGKERSLPLHPEVLLALKALPMPRTGWIFNRPRGGSYSPTQLSQNFNAFLKRSCGDTAPTAHQLRHWFGTNLYAQSHDIRMTQEMLGHASPATTAIYTAFDRRAAAAAIGNMTLNGPEAA
jgi:integrase